MTFDTFAKILSDWGLWFLGLLLMVGGAFYALAKTSLLEKIGRALEVAKDAKEVAVGGDPVARQQIGRVEKHLTEQMEKGFSSLREEVGDLADHFTHRFDVMSRTQQEHERRLTQMEEFLKHAPTNRDLRAIERKVGDVDGRLKAQSAILTGTGKTVDLIHQHLLGQAGNGGGK